MLRKIFSILGLLVLFILFAGSPFLSVSVFASQSSAAPMVPGTNSSIIGKSVTSKTWAGYAIKELRKAVTSVSGSWTQPAIDCPSVTTLEEAAFWVGIDGFGSKTVEQTGTDAECTGSGTTPAYYAWYEFYPEGTVLITSITASPGNVFTASVTYSATTKEFTTTIRDVTTGVSFSHTQAFIAARLTAEWIVEAPPDEPMPNFGIASFASASAITTTISGNIGSFGSAVREITMKVAPTIKATPSALASGGSSFTVTWDNSGP